MAGRYLVWGGAIIVTLVAILRLSVRSHNIITVITSGEQSSPALLVVLLVMLVMVYYSWTGNSEMQIPQASPSRTQIQLLSTETNAQYWNCDVP